MRKGAAAWRAAVLLAALVALMAGWSKMRPAEPVSALEPAQPAQSAKPAVPVEPLIATPGGAPANAPSRAPGLASRAPEVKSDLSTPAANVAEDAPVQEANAPGRSLAELELSARTGDPKAARDWADALRHCLDMVFSELSYREPRFASHLGWNLIEARAGKPTPLTGPLADQCRQLFPDPQLEAFVVQAQSMFAEALQLWAASGDPLGQLVASTRGGPWPPPPERWRQQQAWAEAYLDPANPQTLVDLAEVFAEGSRYRYSEAWRLAACDLGYDCSAGGALQTRLCEQQQACTEANYEEGLLRDLPPRTWQVIQRQRQALLEALRRGDTRSVFDVPPPAG